MNCPDSEKWLLSSLGELSVNEAAELLRHRRECVDCRRAARVGEQMLADLGSRESGEASADVFVSQVLQACVRAELAPLPVKKASRARAVLLVSALAAAAAAMVVMPPQAANVDEHWTARGKGPGSSLQQAQAELFYVRAGKALAAEGAALHAGDGFLVRCANASEKQTFLAVFARDAQGEIHWLYPAYSDASQNPRSIEIAAHAAEHVLDEVVEPDAPALGPMRVFALFTDAPLSVREVEARLLGGSSANVSARFGKARIREWSVSWSK